MLRPVFQLPKARNYGNVSIPKDVDNGWRTLIGFQNKMLTQKQSTCSRVRLKRDEICVLSSEPIFIHFLYINIDIFFLGYFRVTTLSSFCCLIFPSFLDCISTMSCIEQIVPIILILKIVSGASNNFCTPVNQFHSVDKSTWSSR